MISIIYAKNNLVKSTGCLLS